MAWGGSGVERRHTGGYPGKQKCLRILPMCMSVCKDAALLERFKDYVCGLNLRGGDAACRVNTDGIHSRCMITF